MIDLNSLKRVSAKDPARLLIAEPFRQHGWSISTDGHVMLMARGDIAADEQGEPSVSQYLLPMESCSAHPVATVELSRLKAWLAEGFEPRPEREVCPYCSGDGLDEEGWECWRCSGDGALFERKLNAGRLLGVAFNRNLLADALVDCDGEAVSVFVARHIGLHECIAVDGSDWRAVVMPIVAPADMVFPEFDTNEVGCEAAKESQS